MVKEEAFMKLYRNLIILVAVLLILVGGIVTYKLTSKNDTSAVDDKMITLTSFDREKITEFTLEGTEGKIAFKKNGTEWELASGDNFPLSEPNITSVVTNISDLRAYKLIEENASSMDKYGLDKPYKITYKMADGTEGLLEIGSMTPTNQGYYVKKGDSKTVYVIYTYTGDALVATKEDLRNRNIFDVNSAEIIKFAMDRNGKKAFAAEKSEQEGWQLSVPIKGNANLVKLSTISDAFVRTQGVSYKEVNAQELSQYGLDNPAYVIEAATTDKSVKLLLGKKDEKKSTIYAMFDGSNEIFSVDANSLSFVDIKPIELCDTLVYCPTIYDVSETVVSIDGKTITAKIQSDSAKPEDDKFSIDGIDVMNKGTAGEEAFKNYYRSLVGLTFNEIEFLDQKPTGTPEITITYSLEKAPGKMVVEFIPKDDRTYYIIKNGQYSSMVIRKSVFDQADGARKNYENLMKLVK